MADSNSSKNPSPITNIPAKRALDASYYNLDEQELGFFKSQTGIQDENELKQHIIKVQADAYEVRSLSYLGLRLPTVIRPGPPVPLHSQVCLHEVRVIS